MRILYISAGTADFFSGACIRDNALVHAMRSTGDHEVHLMPLYFPMTLDKEDASDCPLFLGGVNLWLQDKLKVFRHTPRFMDKLFDHQLMLKLAGRRTGAVALSTATDAHAYGRFVVNALHGLDRAHVKEIRRMQDWLRQHLEIDLICVSSLLLLGLAPALREVYDVPIVATMQGEDSTLDALPPLYRDQAWALLQEKCQGVAGFIGVSHYHARMMEQRLGIDREIIHVVYNGIDLNGFAPAPASSPVPVARSEKEIGFLARMHPAKGLHILVDAFIMLSDNIPEARLRVIGSTSKADREYVQEQRQKINDAGLDERVVWLENVTRAQKIEALQALDVLCVPTVYPESFGLYILEALACAVPVILPARGSFVELVDDTGGGMVYDLIKDKHEVDLLADALKQNLPQTQRLREWGSDGRAAVLNRYDVKSMAAGITESFALIVERELAES